MASPLHYSTVQLLHYTNKVKMNATIMVGPQKIETPETDPEALVEIARVVFYATYASAPDSDVGRYIVRVVDQQDYEVVRFTRCESGKVTCNVFV